MHISKFGVYALILGFSPEAEGAERELSDHVSWDGVTFRYKIHELCVFALSGLYFPWIHIKGGATKLVLFFLNVKAVRIQKYFNSHTLQPREYTAN